MSPSLQKRFKKSLGLILLLLIGISTHGQPIHLLSEHSIRSVLPSKSVKGIATDRSGRIWIGTEKGLTVLGESTESIAKIIKQLDNQSLNSIYLFNDYLVVSVLNEGLQIYDIQTGNIELKNKQDAFKNIRRFREIDGILYALSTKSVFKVNYESNKWKVKLIPSDLTRGFHVDIFKWKGDILTNTYNGPNTGKDFFYTLLKDSLIRKTDLDFFISKSKYQNPKYQNFLSAASNDSSLVIGLDGFYTTYTDKKGFKLFPLSNTSLRELYATWDIATVKDKFYLAIGMPNLLKKGALLESNSGNLSELKDDFYPQVLIHDSVHNGLWTGTYGRGAFYWPNISSSYFVGDDRAISRKIVPYSREEILLIGDKSIKLYNLKTEEKRILLDRVKNPAIKMIFDAIVFNDTIAVLATDKVFLLNSRGNILNTIENSHAPNGYSHLFKRGENLYMFSYYSNHINKINIRSNEINRIDAPSTLVKSIAYKDKIIYHSDGTGFYFFDSIPNMFKNGNVAITDFTVSGDTLWIFHLGGISRYKIDIPHKSLIKLDKNPFSVNIDGFLPEWIISNNQKIIVGDQKGYVLIDNKTIRPVSYTYTGNYSKSEKPFNVHHKLFYDHVNYITEIDINEKNSNDEIRFTIKPESAINEHIPFSIYASSSDYIKHQYSLKRIILKKDNYIVHEIYSINPEISFPSGLSHGNYDLQIFVGNKIVYNSELKISLPLLENPTFYIGCLVIITIFIGSAFFNRYQKKTYEKLILNNRMQLLKQNLNPHFVFNALNTIQSLVLQSKNDLAIKSIAAFSDLHRHYLENINKPFISITEEIEFVRKYLQVEHQRFVRDVGFSYEIIINLEGDKNNTRIPPLILQPIVENAVKYCSAKESEQAMIWVEVNQENENIIISVENTLSDKKRNQSGFGEGLKIVRERIEIYNKTFNSKIILLENSILKNCSNGYRTILTIEK